MRESLQGKSVLIAGATGLVGRECLELFLADPAFASVTAIVRRFLRPRNGQERLTIKKIDFDYLEDHPSLFASDQILCALGTTMHQAGTKTAFRRVDYEYPLRIAQLGLAHGARHFLLVSALGANPHSRIFYNRVKGRSRKRSFAWVIVHSPSYAPRCCWEKGRRTGSARSLSSASPFSSRRSFARYMPGRWPWHSCELPWWMRLDSGCLTTWRSRHSKPDVSPSPDLAGGDKTAHGLVLPDFFG